MENQFDGINNQKSDSGKFKDLAVSLFDRAKTIYKSGNTEPSAEQELRDIQEQFSRLYNKEGIIYCAKGIAIILESRADRTDDPDEKLQLFEEAHNEINNAVIEAKKIKWLQPSLLKRQALIKSKLADALHVSGNHHDANLLEKSAFKTLGEMLQEHPDYGEGSFIAVATSFKKLKWSLRKMLFDLGKTEHLLLKPKHTKHRSSQEEVKEYLQDISKMRTILTTLISLTN